jgi:hypothetical protein
MGEWMYTSDFLDLGLYLEVSGQLHISAALPPEKIPQYPLDRLGGPQSRSEWRGKEKILDPTGTRTPTARSSNQ